MQTQSICLYGLTPPFDPMPKMNSLRRMLNVLDLFKPEQSVIDAETISTQLGYTSASAYRYLRELVDVGLLVRFPRGYALGPRVIELDRQMTNFDPLLVASRGLVDELVKQTGLEVLVCELYGATVINVLQRSGVDDLEANFGRGRPMDLFRSATARVILAFLLPRQLRRIYDSDPHQEELHHIGEHWQAFSKAMLAIRKTGYCISEGELDQENSGIAAPIFDEKRRILGSITLLGRSERFMGFNEDYLAGLVTSAANRITEQISGNATESGVEKNK